MSPARKRAQGRTAWAVGLLVLASLASLPLAGLFGAWDVPPGQALDCMAAAALRALSGLTGHAAPTDPALATLTTVVVDLRLGRACLAWTLGAGLALSGATFQGILRNPLADPFTLGVSSGAAFGAALAITLGLAGLGGLGGLGWLPPAGLAGALASLGAVLLLARLGGRLRRETLVLAGIVTATFLSAGISLVKSLNEESVAAIVFWIMGSLQGRGWLELALYAPYFLVGAGVILLHGRELDLLSLGSRQAVQLGLNAGRTRLLLLTAASVMAGAAVAVSGVIGFVGLVVPHMVRLVAGPEHRRLLPLSALGGGLLLVWADVLSRTMLPHGAELPVGVLTALLGGPFFCLLLRRRREDAV
ncbi:MAG: FecCD family ABC transporter permease [Desulfovibrionaceae bacterium]